MISHALTIVINELDAHLAAAYGANGGTQAQLANVGEILTGQDSKLREMLNLSLVNIKEEKALKNLPNYTRNDIKLTAVYENQPIYLNFQILLSATHSSYGNGLLMLSRAIRFFQFHNVFTQDTVAPVSISNKAPVNALDRLVEFKLVFDLYSPSMEEVNHLWGTLGGKQYPFAVYMMRMLDFKFSAIQSESTLINEIVSDFYQQPLVASR